MLFVFMCLCATDNALYPGLIWKNVADLLSDQQLASLPKGTDYLVKLILATLFTLSSASVP